MEKILPYHIFVILFALIVTNIGAQNTPPSLPQRTITSSATQYLHFGDFTLKNPLSSGSVSVSPEAVRTATGDVVLLNMGSPVQQAIFEVKLCPGRSITISYSPTIFLYGNHGGSMTLHIGPTNVGSNGAVFTSNKGCDNIHQIKVGGTLDVGSISSNPPGLYTGTFNLTFIQQ